MNKDNVAVLVAGLEECMLDVAIQNVDMLHVGVLCLPDCETKAIHMCFKISICFLSTIQKIGVDSEILETWSAIGIERERLLCNDFIASLLFPLCLGERLFHVQDLLVNHHQILAFLRPVGQLSQVHQLLVHARQRHPAAGRDKVETQHVASYSLLLHADVLDCRNVEWHRDAIDGDEQRLCRIVYEQRCARSLAGEVLGALVPCDLHHLLSLLVRIVCILVHSAALLLCPLHRQLLVALVELLPLRFLLLLCQLSGLVIPELHFQCFPNVIIVGSLLSFRRLLFFLLV
mmetsp:Transcript_19705/g.40166  ORF Transcript_19705/g.40166 Transcript_19705/m.40166 type:complete len:289 (+) Transcript_19705:1318-2184(+)